MEYIKILLNLLKSFGFCWNLLDSWLLRAHATSCELMRAYAMLMMCSGGARVTPKLELLGAYVGFFSLSGALGLEGISSLVF